MPENNDLSERELEILELVATGASNKEIAKELYISSNTVKVHLRNIFTKIGANSRTEAAMYALKQGFIESPVSIGEVSEGEDRSPWIVYGRWLGLIGVVLLILIGAVMISGGQTGPNSNQSNQIPLDSMARWEEKSSLPTSREGLGVVAYESMIYAIAGASPEGATGTVERYDPQVDRWMSLSTKPTRVTDISAAATGGRIYVPGGRTDSGEISTVLEVYDIQENRWLQASSMPVGLSAYALTAFEGKLYLFGGWDGQTYVDTVFEYDPSTDAWQEKTALPTPRGFAGAAVAGGSIYVVGGFDGEQALNVNEVYMPNRDNGEESPWEQAQSLPEGRYGMGIASVSDIIHVIGGIGNEDKRLDPVGYFPQQQAWQTFEMPISQNWSKMGEASIGGDLFVLGGQIEDQLTDKLFSYRAIYTINLPLVGQE